MPYPTAIVSIAFNDGPYVVSPTWTDVSTYVRSFSTDRSRPDDWGNFTGSASVELDNRTRLFDPFYTSGTYYGKLLPRRQIKIEASYGGTTYPVFRGFIDGWPPSWTDAGFDSTVTIQCYDALSLLSQVQLPADWSRSYILSTSPRHYWPMDDPIVPFTVGVETDFGTVPKNLTTFTNAAAASQMALGLSDNCLGGTNLNGDTLATNSVYPADPVVFSADSDFTVASWVVLGSSSSGVQTILSGAVGNFTFLVDGLDTGKFNFEVASGGGGSPNTWTTTTVSNITNNSEPLHIACAWTASSKTAKIYINGVDATGARTTSTAFIVLGANTDVIQISQGPVQQVIVWTSAISHATIQTIVKYSTASFSETTAQRVARIIAETPFSRSLVNAQGTQNILEITDNAPFAGPELQITAQTEGGPLFVNRYGTIVQMALYTQFTSANSFTSQATYGSTGTALQPEVTIAYDASSYRNALNVSMSGGAVVKTAGVVGSGIYGESTQEWPTYAATYSGAKLVGNVLVGLGQYIYPMFEDFQVVLSGGNLWNTTLGLELIERITVKVQPPTGNLITQDLQVSSIQHSVVPGQWQTTLNGSARWAADFRLDYSVLNGPDVIVYTG